MMEENSEWLLEMERVSKRFGATVALSEASLKLKSGEILALIGENGAGKSTLMKILSGAIPPDGGRIYFEGRIYQPKNPLEARHSGIIMVYQELSLAPHLSVADNIMLGLEPTRFGLINRRQLTARVESALTQLGHPEIKPETRVSELSVASRQLVEIARALALGAKVLILDEPTSSLSQKDIERLFQIIARLKTQGLGIIYISHFLEEIKRIADRFLVLRDGKVAGEGEISQVSIDDLVGMMIGRKIEQLYPRSERRVGEVVLELSKLAGFNKLEDASLSLHRGEVLGIAGLLGAGRTELLRAIFGLERVRKGDLKVGAYVGPYSPAQRWRQSLGMLSEDRLGEGLASNLSISDNLTLSKLKGLGPSLLILPSRQRRITQKWMREMGIRAQSPNQKVEELSGGNQQKVALARLLYHEVDILLLDEPTRGIDVASKAQIYQLIDQLVSSSQPAKAILLVSSYLPELIGICDRVAVMHRGKLGKAYLAKEITEHQLMLLATGQS